MSRAARVEEVGDIDAGGPAGPSSLPADFFDNDAGEEEEEDPEDEEGGRFFGGGVSKKTAEILDFMDERDKEDPSAAEKIDSAWLRRTALAFERRINKNAEMRGKFEDDPHKYAHRLFGALVISIC